MNIRQSWPRMLHLVNKTWTQKFLWTKLFLFDSPAFGHYQYGTRRRSWVAVLAGINLPTIALLTAVRGALTRQNSVNILAVTWRGVCQQTHLTVAWRSLAPVVLSQDPRPLIFSYSMPSSLWVACRITCQVVRYGNPLLPSTAAIQCLKCGRPIAGEVWNSGRTLTSRHLRSAFAAAALELRKLWQTANGSRFQWERERERERDRESLSLGKMLMGLPYLYLARYGALTNTDSPAKSLSV